MVLGFPIVSLGVSGISLTVMSVVSVDKVNISITCFQDLMAPFLWFSDIDQCAIDSIMN